MPSLRHWSPTLTWRLSTCFSAYTICSTENLLFRISSLLFSRRSETLNLQLVQFSGGRSIRRTPQAAGQLARLVKMAIPANLALEGAFTFGPGAQVTCVPEVKGLAFDHVVNPDVGAGRYADTLEARRALYVAATRASSQLLLATPSTPSPLIRHD